MTEDESGAVGWGWILKDLASSPRGLVFILRTIAYRTGFRREVTRCLWLPCEERRDRTETAGGENNWEVVSGVQARN